MRLVLVPPAKVAVVWPHVAEWVSEALIRGSADQAPEDVRQALDRGMMQLWLIWDGKPVAVGVTEVLESPRGRACNIVALSGEQMQAWRHLFPEFVRQAREWGCVRLTLIGRKGWARRLAGEEWVEKAVTLEKRIDG